MSLSVAALKFPESSAGNYFDFHSLHAHTIARPDAPPYTQPNGIFRALHTALVELEGIGCEAWFKRHRLAGSRFRDAMRACGLSMLPETDAGHNLQGALSDTVTAVRLPDEVNLERFRREMVQAFGIYVLGNLGEFADCSFRVRLMSPPQIAEENLTATLQAIPAALEQAIR
jgi:aspartate aminotransferase-like enzyme